MINKVPPEVWQKEFSDNTVNFVTDLSQSVSTQPSITYQQLDDALKATIAKMAPQTGGMSLGQFNYQYGEVVTFAGPITPQCTFQCINNGRVTFSGVELWLASTPDSPGTPHAAMLPVLVNELAALAKG